MRKTTQTIRYAGIGHGAVRFYNVVCGSRPAVGKALSVLCLLAVCAAAAATPGRDAIVGFWKTAGGGAVFRIERAAGHYRGRVVWRRAGGADDKMLLTGLTYSDEDGDGRWLGGHIYNINDGKRYRCYVWLEDADHLKLRGYIGVALFGKTTTWRRVTDPRRAQIPEARRRGYRNRNAHMPFKEPLIEPSRAAFAKKN